MDLLFQLVPQLGIVLTAVNIVTGMARDMFATQPDASGLVPVNTYTFLGTRADLVRRYTPITSYVAFLNCAAVGLTCLCVTLDLKVTFEVRGIAVTFPSPESIALFVNAANLTIIVLTAWLAHIVVTARKNGPPAPAK